MINIRYFVKAPISGWHEVSKERFDSFVANLRKNSTGCPASKKDELVKSRTRIIAE
jgi:hypothetical protein